MAKLFPDMIHNWTREAMDKTAPEDVISVKDLMKTPRAAGVADVTLRDGEQMPGVFFTVEDKLKLAQMLSDVGFIGVEVGYPAVSKEEKEVCKTIAQMKLKIIPVAMTRMVKSDIDAVLDTGINTVDIFTSSSDLKMIYHLKLGKTIEEARKNNLELIETHIQYAVDHGLACAFGIEDCSRADIDYLATMINKFQEVAKRRATSTGPADTTGFMTPLAMYWWIRELRKRIKLPIIVHCHNDYGMATANSIAGWMGGAMGISGSINGIGERCGNAPLEEIVCTLEFIYGVKTNIKLEKLPPLCEFVEQATGIPIHMEKPIVGANCFKHESGIHAGGAIAIVMEVEGAYPGVIYESVPKHLLGFKDSKFVFGKFSGTSILKDVATKEMGLQEIPRDKLMNVIDRIKTGISEKNPKEKLREFLRQYHAYVDWIGLSVDEVKKIIQEEINKP